MNTAVIVPWVHAKTRDEFLKAWNLSSQPPWLIMPQDTTHAGCGAMKNRGIQQAVEAGYETVVVLDDDCHPSFAADLRIFVEQHEKALEPVEVEMFAAVTDPPSRGTPYGSRKVKLPVAASLGFWTGIGDYCGVRHLATNCGKMQFNRSPIHGKYFPLSGMNVAFKPKQWLPWCSFIEVARFDDIWMGWLWQREAYRRGFCFNLGGPDIKHARQSNVWKNLQLEARFLEENETLWARIAVHRDGSYDSLRSLLPERMLGESAAHPTKESS